MWCYNELAEVFFANGIDAVYCLSVNDAFVMDCWQADQKAGNIDFLPDGNGEFSDGMGQNGISYSSLTAVSGRGTTPQIFIDGKHIGGADELEATLS